MQNKKRKRKSNTSTLCPTCHGSGRVAQYERTPPPKLTPARKKLDKAVKEYFKCMSEAMLKEKEGLYDTRRSG
jgi:cytochrome c553